MPPAPYMHSAIRGAAMNSTTFLASVFLLLLLRAPSGAQDTGAPIPPGKMVPLGAHRIHLDCRGQGSPTVVIENGFDEFSVDWVLVQQRVAKTTRICTYDRAGYAWSDPGPKPRTYAQINLELHEVLRVAGEHAPFILVGHSFGGPVVRNYALTYPREVAGIVLAESVSENQRIQVGKQAVYIADWAKGRKIPEPRKLANPGDRPRDLPEAGEPGKIDPPYDRLPPEYQRMHLWAMAQEPIREDAANSERDWSPEYMAQWRKKSQDGSLGNIPLIVLTRAEGGYGNDLDVPAAQMEAERKQAQAALAKLSKQGKQIVVQSGHDLQVEAPVAVAAAVEEIVRRGKK
jgi:pimeloyl-ACP methyl ester carboxylesterase